MIKKVLSIFLVASILFVSGCSSSGGLKPGEPAPFSRVYMANGKDTLLSSFKGKTVALMFWASWCNFSKYAMDDFAEKAAKYKDRSDIVFLAVSIDDDREAFDERIRVRHYENMLHSYSGNAGFDETYVRFGSPAIPKAFLIGPDGVIKSSGSRIEIE